MDISSCPKKEHMTMHSALLILLILHQHMYAYQSDHDKDGL